jgi:hypothetical protein
MCDMESKTVATGTGVFLLLLFLLLLLLFLCCCLYGQRYSMPVALVVLFFVCVFCVVAY